MKTLLLSQCAVRKNALGNLILIVLLFQVSILSSAQGINELWGMSTSGGDENLGVVFSMDGNGNNFQVRNSFKSPVIGEDPRSDLVMFNSKFYGMTDYGGTNDGGVIFEWDPISNVYTKKIDLTFINGYHPECELTLFNGKFYGMTTKGGASDNGVIFEWNPVSNVYFKKITLTPANGGYPSGGLTELNGKLYGMTTGGGDNNNGVIFEWDPATNVYTKKINMSMANGSDPRGSLTLNNGRFYGMTYGGGANGKGVIFEWDPATNVYTKKIDLGPTVGSNPAGNLTLSNGKFYGMTSYGGTNNVGTIFEWNSSTNIIEKKIDLTSTGGGRAVGSLSLSAGNFYGMMYGGGSNNGGTIFEWNPATNVYTKKIDFGPSNGSGPYGSLTFVGDKFYGTTSGGGTLDLGAIFEWDPINNNYLKRINFGVTDGKNPYGILTFDNGKMYGTTRSGGNSFGNGVIFELDPATNTSTAKINFSSAIGGAPEGKLISLNGKFYGTTYSGGANFSGVIFEWNPSTNVYIKKYDFITATGWAPTGILNYYNGKFYGTTFKGGTDNSGVIFEWDPVSEIYTKKYDFGISDGLAGAGMTMHNGKFYGMTVHDGSSGSHPYGVIFEWDPATNQYLKKVDLTAYQGGGFNFSSNLTFNNGKFYGVSIGGTNGLGFIFEWDPVTNSFNKKFDFSSATGSFGATVLTYSQGKFYGMNSYGGTNNAGVIFEWDPVTNVYIQKLDFSGINGRNPSTGNGLITLPSPVADIPKGNCLTLNSVTINSSNNSQWVAITDGIGSAVAEINANGNNLGVVSTSVFVNGNQIREDGGRNLYLDRNLTITPQNQPSTPVSVRLYIKSEELIALINATNSNGESSGVTNINDLKIFKSESGCGSGLSQSAQPVASYGLNWEGGGYVLTASINSFSSFYFAKNTIGALPVKLVSFTGKQLEHAVQLKWNTSSESNSASFEVERSGDGSSFSSIGVLNSIVNSSLESNYAHDDNNPFVGINYYRLKMNDQDGTYAYSKIISVDFAGDGSNGSGYPNPTSDILNILLPKDKNITYRISDVAGRIIEEKKVDEINSSQTLIVDVTHLTSGLYFISIGGEKTKQVMKFVRK